MLTDILLRGDGRIIRGKLGRGFILHHTQRRSQRLEYRPCSASCPANLVGGAGGGVVMGVAKDMPYRLPLQAGLVACYTAFSSCWFIVNHVRHHPNCTTCEPGPRSTEFKPFFWSCLLYTVIFCVSTSAKFGRSTVMGLNQRDVVYLCLPICIWAKCGGGGGGVRGLSQWVQLYSGAQTWRSNSIFNLWSKWDTRWR